MGASDKQNLEQVLDRLKLLIIHTLDFELEKLERVIAAMNMAEASEEFKQDALKAITKSPKMTNERKKRLLSFLNTWQEDRTADGYKVGKTDAGVVIYKARLSDEGGARFFFSVTTVEGRNEKIDANGNKIYNPILIVYDIVFDHDEWKKALGKLLKKYKIK